MTAPNDDHATTSSTDSPPPESKQDQDKAQLRDHAYKLALAAAVLLLASATIVYRIAEDWSWVDSFYFSAIAVSTVGFGDLSPTTDFTKLFTVAYIAMGISLLGSVLNEWLRRRESRRGRRVQSRSRD
jgi:hypothetical protein